MRTWNRRRALFLSQAHLEQLLVDLVDQGLVARDRLGIAGVAFHPAHDLGPVLEELVAHVGIDQLGQRQVLGCHHEKVVAEGQRKLQALVAFEGLQLLPTRSLQVGAGRHFGGLTGALVPAAILSAHGLTGGHGQIDRAAGDLVARRDRGPALGIGVVLFFQDDALVGIAARCELVELARIALAHGTGHSLDDGAGGHAHGHIFQIQSGIAVLLGSVQLQFLLLGIGQVGVEPVGFDLTHVVDEDGQQLQLGAVVHARLDLGLIANQDAIDRAVLGHPDRPHRIRDGRDVDHHAIGAGTLFANALFSQHVHVPDGLDAAGALQTDGVVLSDAAVHHRRADAVQRNRGHVGTRHGRQLIAHAVVSLARVQLDVATHQLSIAQNDQVVGIDPGQGVGVGTGHGRGSEAVGIGRQAGLGLGGQLQIAAEVAQTGPVNADVRAQPGVLGGRGAVECSQANGIDPYLVHGEHVGDRLHTEHAGAACRLGHQVGALAHRDGGTKALIRVPEIGGRAEHLQRTQAAAKGLHGVVQVGITALVGGVARRQQDVARRDLVALADAHIGRALDLADHQRTAASQQTHGQVEGRGIELLIATRRHVQGADRDAVVIAQKGLGVAADGDRGIRPRQAQECPARGGRGLLEQLVFGFGADAQHRGRDRRLVAQASACGAAVQGGHRRHAHGRAGAHAQRIRSGKAGLQGLGADRDLAARAFGGHIGIVNEGIDHRLHVVDRHGARCSCSDQAEAGRRRQHTGVLLSGSIGQQAQLALGAHLGLAQRVLRARHLARGTVLDAGQHLGEDGVGRHRAAAGKGEANPPRDGHGHGRGTALDAGSVQGADANVAVGTKHRIVHVGLGRTCDFVECGGHAHRHRAGQGAKGGSH